MICDDGRFLVNKFLLVSIFPIMKDLLSIENESLIISLPGTNLDKIQEFFFNVYNQCKNIPVDSFILKLTERLDVEVKDEIVEVNDNYFKNNVIDEDVFAPNDNEEIDDKAELFDHSNSEWKPKKSKQEDSDYNDTKVKKENFKKSDSKIYKCNYCGKEFVQKCNRDRHVKSSVCKTNSCPTCGKVFTISGKFARKHISECKIIAENCHLCGKAFTNSLMLKAHMKKHQENSKRNVVPDGYVRCPKCKIKIIQSEFNSHKCTIYPCHECGKQFATKAKVHYHYKAIHEKAYTKTCEICGKVCASSSVLDYHHRTEHENEPMVSCDICGKQFSFEASLSQHKRTHEEKITCHLCPMKIRAKLMKNHIANMHTDDSEKNYQCTDCGKGFLNKKSLEAHTMSVHLKLRPYKCRYGCAFAYNDASNRGAHERKVHGAVFDKKNDIKLVDEPLLH